MMEHKKPIKRYELCNAGNEGDTGKYTIERVWRDKNNRTRYWKSRKFVCSKEDDNTDEWIFDTWFAAYRALRKARRIWWFKDEGDTENDDANV